MNLRELLERRDYSGLEIDRWVFGAYYDGETIGQILNHGDYVDYEHFNALNDTGRFMAYWLRKWWCSDQHVGLQLITLDDEPVMLKYQTGRKSRPSWSFVNDDAFAKVKAVFEAVRPVPEDGAYDLLDESWLRLVVDDETLGDITHHQLGLSDISIGRDLENALRERLRNLEVQDDENWAEVLEVLGDQLKRHAAFIGSIGGEDRDRAIAESQERFQTVLWLHTQIQQAIAARRQKFFDVE